MDRFRVEQHAGRTVTEREEDEYIVLDGNIPVLENLKLSYVDALEITDLLNKVAT